MEIVLLVSHILGRSHIEHANIAAERDHEIVIVGTHTESPRQIAAVKYRIAFIILFIHRAGLMQIYSIYLVGSEIIPVYDTKIEHRSGEYRQRYFRESK